ncbi:hypothetical protein SG34_004115 [Thalassomonas viridans]|uniref:Uncharacterized protein n=1 Tax=Thalassomonas viridans TaxID=137584 RepID=A0AAE9Z4Y3_9GAMM|nr:hypothetical protein [Thalassomonas viridans]WDE06124.1 hypothetical protein SG34_004115 [Thalassomonas viridans]
MHQTLITKLIGIVRQKLKEQQLLPEHNQTTIMQILNESGVGGIGFQAMAELRAEVLAGLGIGLCPPGTLRQNLQGFLFDYDVFRPSELRYYFPADPEAEIFSNLTELGYILKTQVEEDEPIWRPKLMRRDTVKKKLAARDRVGSPEYLAYLSYRPMPPSKLTKH